MCKKYIKVYIYRLHIYMNERHYSVKKRMSTSNSPHNILLGAVFIDYYAPFAS